MTKNECTYHSGEILVAGECRARYTAVLRRQAASAALEVVGLNILLCDGARQEEIEALVSLQLQSKLQDDGNKVIVSFCGIDSRNRPVFKVVGEEFPYYIGDCEKLFDPYATEKEVLEFYKGKDLSKILVYFGEFFGCEPSGRALSGKPIELKKRPSRPLTEKEEDYFLRFFRYQFRDTGEVKKIRLTDGEVQAFVVTSCGTELCFAGSHQVGPCSWWVDCGTPAEVKKKLGCHIDIFRESDPDMYKNFEI